MKPFKLPLLALFAAFTAPTQAVEPKLPADGWASWEVPAVEDAPFWCCWSGWDKGSSLMETCDLDEVRGNQGSRDKETTDSVRMYVHVTGGKVDRLHAFLGRHAHIQPVEAVADGDPDFQVVDSRGDRTLGAAGVRHEGAVANAGLAPDAGCYRLGVGELGPVDLGERRQAVAQLGAHPGVELSRAPLWPAAIGRRRLRRSWLRAA